MHYTDAIGILRQHQNQVLRQVVGPPKVNFISPAVSTILAARRLIDPSLEYLGFATADCESYANNTGLLSVLRGSAPVPNMGSLTGKTYSPLTKLSNAAEVKFCNEGIANVLHNNLSNASNAFFVHQLAKIVGELHDNVAAHASGAAFSATQVYAQRLEFAIADCGCGMLRNVRKVQPGITTFPDAISWCLKKGNTSAKPRDDMAQRLPEDCVISPLPDGMDTFTDENHHVGEGLWKLTELLKSTSGRGCIWSGNGMILISDGEERAVRCDDLTWQGVVIELEFNMKEIQALGDTSNTDLSDIAARLGL